MTIFIILISYTIAALFVLIQTRYYVWGMTSSKTIRAVVLIALILLMLLPVLGTFLPVCAAKFFFMKWGNVLIGILGGYAVVLVIAWIFRTMLRLVLRNKIDTKDISRSACTIIICVALAFMLGTSIYGQIKSVDVKAEYYTAEIHKGSEEADAAGDAVRKESMRIVLAADLHLSVNSRPSTMAKMVKLINQQNPDVVIIGGDIFTSTYDGLKDPEKYIKELKQIKSKYGVYAVYGNHDVEEDLFCGFAISPASEAVRDPRMTQFMKDCGFKILEDDVAVLPNGVTVAGRADESKPLDKALNRKTPAELLKDCDHTKPIIVAEHEPGEYKALAKAGADIVLSGHTHNGQVFPGNIAAYMSDVNNYGYQNVDGMHTYVCAGAGFFGPPMRLGTESDIFVIDMEY